MRDEFLNKKVENEEDEISKSDSGNSAGLKRRAEIPLLDASPVKRRNLSMILEQTAQIEPQEQNY
jgi:hypothetical protein